MILLTLRKFWWIPLLVIAGGLFILPASDSKSSSSNVYSSLARIRTRSAFAAELRSVAERFKDSSECLKGISNVKAEVLSTREDEYIFIDFRFTSNDSIQLAKFLPALDECIHSDSSINKLVFNRVNEIQSLQKQANQLIAQLTARDSVSIFLLKKDEFDLKMRKNDIQDHYRYQAATSISPQKSVSGGSSIKRILILSLIGIFLMILVAELSRHRKTEE
jgi:hypothetical protein